jgi:hypothetical protein
MTIAGRGAPHNSSEANGRAERIDLEHEVLEDKKK